MRYKVLNPEGEHVASTAYAEEAAMLMACLGPGAKVTTYGRKLLWHEGDEFQGAAESYDACANHIRSMEGK